MLCYKLVLFLLIILIGTDLALMKKDCCCLYKPFKMVIFDSILCLYRGILMYQNFSILYFKEEHGIIILMFKLLNIKNRSKANIRLVYKIVVEVYAENTCCR